MEQETLSVSQFADLLGIDPARLVSVNVDRPSSTVTMVFEPMVCIEEPGGRETYVPLSQVTLEPVARIALVKRSRRRS